MRNPLRIRRSSAQKGPPRVWPRFDTAPRAAFLDVDGTLLAETTTYLFARLLRKSGMIGRSFLLRSALHGLQHRFGRLDYGRLIEYGLRSIAGVPYSELERISYVNFVEYIRPRLYIGVEEHLADLRSRGTRVVLVSSSPGLVTEPLGRYLGCTANLTTPVRIESDQLVGLGQGPPCYGEGKRYWAEEWARAAGIAMDETVAYADNWSDRALLERAGQAVVVHPHGRLERLADCRGWIVVRPRRPGRRQRRRAQGL